MDELGEGCGVDEEDRERVLMEKEEDIGFVRIWKTAEEIFVFYDVQVLI